LAPKPAFRTLAIIGTGLIGTSVGLALKERAPALKILGWDTSKASARTAKRRGAIDKIADSLRHAVATADCIVLAPPLEAVLKVLPLAIRAAKPQTFIIDVAGLKAPVLAVAARELRKRHDLFVAGGHPLAGAERAGPANARADLFEQRPFVLCIPAQAAASGAIRKRARKFVRMLGGVPVELGAGVHDRIVAATSALPQLVACCLALAVRDVKPLRNLVGPGYQGMTRLAASPFGMWEASLSGNRRNVRRALAVFELRVRDLRRALEKADVRALRGVFEQASAARRMTTSR